MSDLISRQAAIEALDKRFDSIPMNQTTEILLLRKDLRELPSAQPERMRGKWIDDGDPFMWECGCCGYRVKRYNNTRYCPNCGADMREDDHETD